MKMLKKCDADSKIAAPCIFINSKINLCDGTLKFKAKVKDRDIDHE